MTCLEVNSWGVFGLWVFATIGIFTIIKFVISVLSEYAGRID